MDMSIIIQIYGYVYYHIDSHRYMDMYIIIQIYGYVYYHIGSYRYMDMYIIIYRYMDMNICVDIRISIVDISTPRDFFDPGQGDTPHLIHLLELQFLGLNHGVTCPKGWVLMGITWYYAQKLEIKLGIKF